MPFLAPTQNRSSSVLSTSGSNLVALEQFAPNSPFIALTAPTTCIDFNFAQGYALHAPLHRCVSTWAVYETWSNRFTKTHNKITQ